MSFLIKIAYKNLFRHKLRTFVSITAIAFAVMIVVFARGYIVGMIDSVYSDHIQYNSGHVKIIEREYHRQQRLLPLNYPVDGYQKQGLQEMIEDLEGIENIEMVIPRLKYGAMISTESELVTMTGWGVKPEKEVQFTDIEKSIAEGRMINNGEREVVMGTDLLKKIKAEVGDKVTILSNTAFNSLTGVTFKVVGRVDSGVKMLDEFVFFVPLDQAQHILYMDGQVTELLLHTPDRRLAGEVVAVVKDLFKNKGAEERYLALNYKETSDLLPFMEMAKIIYNVIYVFLVLLASVVVINTMIMIVKERTKEIGMMSALGLQSHDILKLFLFEAGIMGIVGSFIGSLLGSLINAYLSVNGIDFSSALSGFSSDIVINSIIYPISSLTNTIFAFILGVIVVTAACVIPAYNAAELEPTEAMRDS